jgi:ATP-dependent helicase/nuclease subunit B
MDSSSPANAFSISNHESRISNHSIYTGSFAALEKQWIEVIGGLQQSDPLLEINILVGSNILATYLKRRLAESGKTVANIRFYTFLDLANRLAGPSETTQAKARLPRMGASILLEDILAEHTPQTYESLSGFRGFRDALLDTFRDLRDAGFGPQELDPAIQLANRTPDRRRHLQAFADLYRRFREYASKFRDVDDDFRAAIRSVSKPGSIGFSQLLVYGIYDATGQQSRLLTALNNSVQMVYFIPFVDVAVSDFAQPFLDAQAKELGVKPVHLEDQAPMDSLSHLAARGFGFSEESGGKNSLAEDGSFALVSAPGESRAAIEVVREIFRAVSDGTISGFHEAAVILRQPEADTPILTEMLRLHGVQFFIHSGERFADRPLSKAIIALSNLASNSFSREAVLASMELVSAALPEDSLPDWDVQGWRSLTNNPRFIAGLQSWTEGTDAIVEEARREIIRAESLTAETIDDDGESGTHSAQTAMMHLESSRHLRNAWLLIRQAAADWPPSQSWQDWASFLDQRFGLILGTSKDWPLFSSVLDEIGGLPEFEIRDSRFEIRNSAANGQGRGISAERLKSALAESISSLAFPAGRFQRSGINLLSTSAARGLRFPLVIIPGLDEGRFPAKLRQDPLLLDSDRSQLKNLPLKSRRIEEEKLLFDMAARSAEKRLVLMTSRLDESSDRERIPSQFFLRVAAAIRGDVVSIRDLTRDLVPGFRSVSLDNPAPAKDEVAIDEGEIRLRLITAEKVTARMALNALAEREPLRFNKPMAFDHDRWISKLTGFDGLISDPRLKEWTVRKVGISAGPVSASRIEEYAKCPYYFFLKRVMDLEAWEEKEKVEGMDPLERGLVVHSILENFLRDSGEEVFRSSSEEKLRDLIEQRARKEFEKARPVGMPDLLWDIERDALVKMLKAWIRFEVQRADTETRVALLEQSFGEFGSKEKSAPFQLKAGKHQYRFRGRIDRIDLSRDGKRARVTDYKTGTLPDTMARKTRTPLMSGEKIQVVVYRGALSVLDGLKGLESIDGEYLHLQPRDSRIVPCSFTDEELREGTRALSGILEIVGDGIEKGVFFARTSGMVRPSGHCEYCDYLTICGKDRIQREERKSNDPAVLRFLGILEPQQ